jgi:hypothetical protein
MTKNLGLDYLELAKEEDRPGRRLLSTAFDALFPFILICIAYLASRHFLGA